MAFSSPTSTDTSGRRLETSSVRHFVEVGPGKHGLWVNFTPTAGKPPVRKTSTVFDTHEHALDASDAFRVSWEHSERGVPPSADAVHRVLGSTPSAEMAELPAGKFRTLVVFADINFFESYFVFILRFVFFPLLDQDGTGM